MRYTHLRYDILLCLLIGLMLSYIPVRIIEAILPGVYESYVEKHTVAEGDIGGIAGENISRARRIKDLLDHDTFTVVSPGTEYKNKGAGYYKNHYMQMLTLPSGETVAAIINEESVQRTEDDFFSEDSILPVGCIVYEDLTQNQTFLNQIEYNENLSRTDFYIDMMGNGGKVSQQDYYDFPIDLARAITIIISFPILHMLGSRIGIFPYFFEPKNKNK